ncbi:hypothetical protein BGW38_003703, partial [Lunasporangiospora selenospora]
PPVLFHFFKLAIVDSEVKPDVSRQVIFRIELQYGDIKWVITRSLYEFYKLHLSLTAKNYQDMPRFPDQAAWAYTMAMTTLGMGYDDTEGYAREHNLARRKALQSYLLQVLECLSGVVAYDLYEFLEISAMSMTKDMGWKAKEGHVSTKAVDETNSICGLPAVWFQKVDRSWAVLRDSYIAFCPSTSEDECSDVFMFDQNFYVLEHMSPHLGFVDHHIEIGNNFRRIEMRADNSREVGEWIDHFNRMKRASPWVLSHRFGSFAPQREDAKVRYYVDGKDYFHAVSDALLAAKSEIYIADWWLSPELYLRRPPEKNEEFRLDRLLQRKAQEGVKIYIVVYKEVSIALTLDSAHTKTWLQDLHPNIQVQRHPDHLKVNGTQFWAHHEKICVVDCRMAFIGGLDLCFGRYDSRTHQLSDYHPSGKGVIWPGQDYSNPRIKDFANVKDYGSDLIERKLLGRMPWHDVSIGVAGQPARDIARHFVQRWNFVKREKGMKKTHMKFLTPKGEFVSTRNETGWTGSQKVQILRSSTRWSQGVDLERSIQDAYLECIEKAEHFIYIENQFFVTLAAENGNPDIKNTIGIALVNRIVRAHNEGKKFRVIVVMPLMPAFEADIMSGDAGTLRKVMHFQYMSICRGGNSVLEQLVANGIDPDQYIGFFGLRSFDRIKHGKFDAIVEAVKEAEEAGSLNEEDKVMAAEAAVGEEVVAAVVEESSAEAAEPQSTHKLRDRLKAKLAQHDDEDISRRKSLATKFLLDPLPNDQDAERIKKIAARRKASDKRRTWDESITKRAMNRCKKEHGFIPAATERTMGNTSRNERIKRNTDRAEQKAKENHYQGGTTENSEPHVIDGLGTIIKTKVEDWKGPKDVNSIEPTGHKIRNALFNRGGDSDVEREREEDEDIIEPRPDSASDFSVGASSTSSTGAGSEDTALENEVEDFVTEQLYIHSKLMIVDDRIIIIGSANINDRSQLGFRDSEIAIVVEDTDMVPSRMNGEPYQAGRLAHTLRSDLFREHLGLLSHVEHDVVTKASVLPVNLDKPSKDPAQVRKELMRAIYEEKQQQEQQQQASLQPQSSTQQQQQPQSSNQRRRKKRGPVTQGYQGAEGYLQVTMPDEEEDEAFQKWHSTLAQGQEKLAAGQDPKAAKEIVMDPVHDSFYESWWRRVANTNTLIFREVFHCVPDDTVENWNDYKEFVPDPKKVLVGHVCMPDATVESVMEKLQMVTGHLVEFPTKFLCQENLLGNVVEGVVTPMEIFT